MTNISIPEHIFISYAHADEEFAKKIAADLEKASIHTWIDRTGLTPGDGNWEKAIRDAINRSFAIVLIASRNSRQSNFVPDELNVARVCGRSVYPIWIAGEEWMDSVPIGMGRTQYIDCRGTQYTTGIAQLIETLKNEINTKAVKHFLLTGENKRDSFRIPQGYFSIKLDEQQIVAIRTGSYQSLRLLQDDLWREYLNDRYLPYTYGKEWIIASNYEKYHTKIGLLVAPWSWLFKPNRNQHIHTIDPRWATSSLKKYGLVAGTDWQIINVPLPVLGIATNDNKMLELMQDMKLGSSLMHHLAIVSIHHTSYMKLVPPETVSTDDYRHLLVCTQPDPKYDGKAFVIDRWGA